MGSIPNTYVTSVRRKDSIQQNFSRHVEPCLQRRVDVCNARSQKDPSNSAARKMAGWFDWNSVDWTLSSWLKKNMVGWLCCNLCKTRCTLLIVKFDTAVNIPCGVIVGVGDRGDGEAYVTLFEPKRRVNAAMAIVDVVSRGGAWSLPHRLKEHGYPIG